MTIHVLYCNVVPPDLFELVRQAAPPGWQVDMYPAQADQRGSSQARADYLVVAAEPVDAALLDATPRVKMVQHQGVGYDKVDVAELNRRAIPFALTPEGTTEGVAEHVFALLLCLNKHMAEAEASLGQGQWLQWELRTRSYEVAEKTFGLIGYGRIGQAVAKRAVAFDAHCLYYDPWLPAGFSHPDADRVDTLEELLRRSDVVSLHAPATAETKHLIGASEIAAMKPDAVLINTARGSLIDEAALLAALTAGRIRGAGLDVFEQEPLPPDSPWRRGLERAVVVPHIAAGTRDAYSKKMRAIFANLERHSRGQAVLNTVTA
ncbi:MAG: 2-hydroxyacid dehydrogenase [Propionibacteriaceae bacterium]|jgi:phosphoglycerate dehydrogenase-like enzyme|nr:2-hydroxyacid dehydrogenase [Propionibacteriaceae bacterium]